MSYQMDTKMYLGNSLYNKFGGKKSFPSRKCSHQNPNRPIYVIVYTKITLKTLKRQEKIRKGHRLSFQ